MFLKKTKSNNKTYLSFVEGYRIDGKVKQRTVKKIGYLEEFEKIYDDPITYFKKVAKKQIQSWKTFLKNHSQDI